MSNVTDTCCSTSATELCLESSADYELFSSVAVDIHKAVERTDSELMHSVVKMQPVLKWIAVSASELCDDLVESEMSAIDQSNNRTGCSEALVKESVGYGGDENLTFACEQAASDNTFEISPLNVDDIYKLCSDTGPVRSDTVHAGAIPDSVLTSSSDHLRMQLDYAEETHHYNKTCIYGHTGNCLNSNLSIVNASSSHRRCFSCDNVFVVASVYSSSSRPLSVSADAVYTGNLAAVEYGREVADAECLQLDLQVTWSRYDESQLALTAADQSDNSRLTDGEVGGHCQPGAAGARIETVDSTEHEHWESLQSDFVVAGRCRVVDVPESLAETREVSWPAHQSAAKSPPPGEPITATADIPAAAAAADNTASYFASELRSCLPCCSSSTDVVMGQQESSTHDANMQTNTVESMDISSTLAVKIRGDADTRRSRFTGWDSLLNPAQSACARDGDVAASCGVVHQSSATAARADDQRDVGGQRRAVDTLGWASSERASDDQVQLAGQDSGRAPVTRHSQLTCSNVNERSVSAGVHYQDRDAAGLYSDEGKALTLERTDDVIVETDNAVSCGGSHANTNQQKTSSVSLSAPRAGRDDSLQPRAPAAAVDECASAAVSAGVTDEGLTAAASRTLNWTHLHSPPAVPTGHATSLTRRLTHAVQQLADHKPPISDDDRVENVIEAELAGGITVASDVDVVSMGEAGQCEVFSSLPASCSVVEHVSAESDSDALSTTRDDDVDVDRKLAIELERLKNLVANSSKTHTDQTAAVKFSHSEEPCVHNLDDASDLSTFDSGCSHRQLSVDTGDSETDSSELVLELQDVVEQYTDDSCSETVADLPRDHVDSLTDDTYTSLKAEPVADDSNNASSEPPTDNLHQAASAADQLQVIGKVSYREHHTVGALKRPRLIILSILPWLIMQMHR